MLVITRKTGEKIEGEIPREALEAALAGEGKIVFSISVAEVRKSNVRVGLEADVNEVKFRRGELEPR